MNFTRFISGASERVGAYCMHSCIEVGGLRVDLRRHESHQKHITLLQYNNNRILKAPLRNATPHK